MAKRGVKALSYASRNGDAIGFNLRMSQVLGALMIMGIAWLIKSTVEQDKRQAVMAEQLESIRQTLSGYMVDRWTKTDHVTYATSVETRLNKIEANEADMDSRIRSLEKAVGP